jgi:hypothetical protein
MFYQTLGLLTPGHWDKDSTKFFMLWISGDAHGIELKFPKMPPKTPMRIYQACIPIRYLVEAFHTAYISNTFRKDEAFIPLTAFQEDNPPPTLSQRATIKRKRG